MTSRRDHVREWLGVTEHRWIVGLAVVALGLRAGWALAILDAYPTIVGSGDQYGYVRHGRDIAAGAGYVSYTTGEPTAYYPIGYPALLGALFWVLARLPATVDLPNAVALLHAVLGASVVVSVWVLGRRALGSVAAVVAAGVVALHPDLIAYTATYTLETTFVASALGALAVLAGHDWALGAPSWRRLVVFAVAMGVAANVRPFVLPFVAAMVLAIVLAGAGWRRAGASALAVLSIVVVLLVPWTARNLVQLDAVVPFSTNLGDTACMSRFPGSEGGFAFAAHRWCADPELPEVERSSANLRAAVDFVQEHPGEEVRLLGRRLTKMFEHGHSGMFEASYSGRGPLDDSVQGGVEDLSDAWLVGTLVLGVPGLLLVAARRWRTNPGRALIVLPALTLFVIPLGLWGNPRFAMPLAPFLALGVGCSVSAAVGALRR